MAGRDRQTKREIGIVPFGADRVEAKAFGRKSRQSGRTLCNGVAQQKGFSNPMLTVKVSGQPDSQLESWMQEICQSGSGGGAVLSRPYLIIMGQLQALFARHNAGAALSAKAVFKPTKEFHTARHTLYSAEENMEIDKVVPAAASMKTKLEKGGTGEE